MAVSLVSVKCPECGATLNIESDRDFAFCSYCGTKVLLHNENEHIYRHIDEAGVKQAETDRIIRMKQMELIEKKRADAERTKALKIKISLIMAAIGILMMTFGYMAGAASGDSDSGFYMIAIVGMFPLLGAAYIWILSKKNEDDNELDFGDMARVPTSISDYNRKSYNAIEAILSSAGFTNIKCVPLNDLTVGVMKKPGIVDSITINGKEVTSGGKKYPKDAAVVISYHSMSR